MEYTFWEAALVDTIAMSSSFATCAAGGGKTFSDDALHVFLSRIFTGVAFEGLACCRATSKCWRSLAEGSAAWRAVANERFPTMVAAVLADSASGQCVDWFALYLARCMKRRTWMAEREAAKTLKSEKVARIEGQAFGVPDSSPKCGRQARAVREKTCKRCGTRFSPAVSGIECHYHTGKYMQVDEDGVAVPDHRGASLQHQVKEQLRRRGKRGEKCHLELAAAPQSRTGARGAKGALQALEFRWSCCGEEVLTSQGCVSGRHS